MSPTNIRYSKWKPSDHTFSPPPRYDSNGKKVPIWDTVEVDVREDEKNFLEKQSSWKYWISRASSWGNLEKQSSWKYWISRASSWGNVRQKSIGMLFHVHSNICHAILIRFLRAKDSLEACHSSISHTWQYIRSYCCIDYRAGGSLIH
jgi:hypothetical protein